MNTIRICNKCGHEVRKETDRKLRKDYPYYCPECDENMYDFETHSVETHTVYFAVMDTQAGEIRMYTHDFQKDVPSDNEQAYEDWMSENCVVNSDCEWMISDTPIEIKHL